MSWHSRTTRSGDTRVESSTSTGAATLARRVTSRMWVKSPRETKYCITSTSTHRRSRLWRRRRTGPDPIRLTCVSRQMSEPQSIDARMTKTSLNGMATPQVRVTPNVEPEMPPAYACSRMGYRTTQTWMWRQAVSPHSLLDHRHLRRGHPKGCGHTTHRHVHVQRCGKESTRTVKGRPSQSAFLACVAYRMPCA